MEKALAAVLTREIRAPRGKHLGCKGWTQEAAMRMLMNNLDPKLYKLLPNPSGARDADEAVRLAKMARAAV